MVVFPIDILSRLLILCTVFITWIELSQSESITDERGTINIFNNYNGELYISKQQIEEFKSRYHLNDDAELSLQRVSPENHVSFGGKAYSFENMEEISIFTNDATYEHNGVPDEIPNMINVFQMEDENEIVTVEKYSDGSIKQIMIVNKVDGRIVELVSISRGILVTIQSEAFDIDNLNLSFRYENREEKTNDQDDFKVYPIESKSEKIKNRKGCTSYKEIELAVVYESSYCAKYGFDKESSDRSVISLVALVSSRYEQESLCQQVKISHLEGHCNIDTDPYKDLVDLNTSGCDGYGLLTGFQSYWNEKKAAIERDTTHLFSGTGLECSDAGCLIGCANVDVTCDKQEAYAVNYVTYTESQILRSTLVAHEMGHNNGASHISDEEHIMNPSVTGANRGFSQGSIRSFKRYFEGKNCLDVSSDPLIIKLLAAAIEIGWRVSTSFISGC